MLNLLFIFKGPYVTKLFYLALTKGSTHHNTWRGLRVSIFLLRVRDKILPSNDFQFKSN